jgi:hypothetical protein
MGPGLIPNTPPDASKGRQDPYGLGGDSYVEYGTCPIDSPSLLTQMIPFANAQLHLYDHLLHGQFFWTFRTELETTWDYSKAVAVGWLPSDWDEDARKEAIVHACDGYATSPDAAPPSEHKEEEKKDEKESLTADEKAWIAWYKKEKSVLFVITIVLAFGAMLFLLFYIFRRLAVYHQSYMASAPPVDTSRTSRNADWRSALMGKQRSMHSRRGYQAIPDTTEEGHHA